MKKIIFSFIACLFIGTICAQPQYSPKAQIHKNQISLKAQRAKGSSQEWYIPATLQASDIDELEEYGTHVASIAAGSGYGKINPYAGLYYILEANNISAPQQDNGVTLYPTIGNGEFNIVSPEYSSDMTISIYTSSGIYLSTTTLQEIQPGTPVEWLIPGSQQGVYYINICTNRGSKTYKFVKL